jgi:acetate kinase
VIVVVLNAGSSSIKASLHAVPALAVDAGEAPPPVLWQAEVDPPFPSLDDLLGSMWRGPKPAIDGPAAVEAVGHRVVHGGAALRESTLITPEARAAIARVGEYAPAHNALELAGVDAAARLFGRVPQVAVFDTAFHSTLPPAAYTYAGPYAWVARGIRRYGFHGLSHEYASRRAARLLSVDPASLRIVTCHLGSGCSLAAVHGGRSVDTTMGFTPLDGLAMATRSGAVDPGILLHLLRHEGHAADTLDRMLNQESGLAGLSGVSGDMRRVLAALDAGDARAALAFDVYVHRVRQGIAAMAASMGGIDCIVFTAGVGEHAPRVRVAVCEGLGFLGVILDADANMSPAVDRIVSGPSSRVAVLVVHAAENWAVARECVRVVSGR